MDFFDVLTLIGGLALFLYGMDVMGDGLKKLAGGKLESFLGRLTSNRFMAAGYLNADELDHDYYNLSSLPPALT